MEYLKAFLCGGVLCAIGQILIDKTKLTPARILVAYVVSGVVLGGLGLYKHVVEWAGAGATGWATGWAGYSFQTFRYCWRAHISSRYFAADRKSRSAAAFCIFFLADSTAFSTCARDIERITGSWRTAARSA